MFSNFSQSHTSEAFSSILERSSGSHVSSTLYESAKIFGLASSFTHKRITSVINDSLFPDCYTASAIDLFFGFEIMNFLTNNPEAAECTANRALLSSVRNSDIHLSHSRASVDYLFISFKEQLILEQGPGKVRNVERRRLRRRKLWRACYTILNLLAGLPSNAYIIAVSALFISSCP